MEKARSDARRQLFRGFEEAVAKEHAFLRRVDDLADVLYDEDVVGVSALRYERLWIPAVSASLKQGFSAPAPPLDIAFIWHCHALCPTRYFSDWQRVAGEVPDFVYPGPGGPASPPPGSPPGLHADIDLSSRAAALESMRRSLGERQPAAGATGGAPTAHGPSLLSYDVAAAALRQRAFFYQVSLPHFEDAAFIQTAVDRYITFLLIRQAHPKTKLCPTYDIDLVWHAHMSMPHRYKADTEALVGFHLSHDDSINDRSAGARLQLLQQDAEALFEEAGEDFFRAGGMFRGVPKVITPQERGACFPEAPPASIQFTLSGFEWKAPSGDSPSAALRPDVAIVAWSLAPASKLPAVLQATQMRSIHEPLEVTSLRRHTLSIRVRDADGPPAAVATWGAPNRRRGPPQTTASVAVNIRELLQVRP